MPSPEMKLDILMTFFYLSKINSLADVYLVRNTNNFDPSKKKLNKPPDTI